MSISRHADELVAALQRAVVDAHGNIHAPAGTSIGGQFLKKLFGGGKEAKGGAVVPAAIAKPKVELRPPRPRGGPSSTDDVRRVLTGAESTSALSGAASGEAKRITGRDIPFDFEGSDLQLAREHAEGVLRGLEGFPDARLQGVSMVDGPNPETNRDSFAWVTTVASGGYRGIPYSEAYEVRFSRDWANPGSADRYREALARAATRTPRMGRGNVDGSPVGVGVHEMGHVVAHSAMADADAGRLARAFADARIEPDADAYTERARRRMVIGNEVSLYGLENDNELAAEAFADVRLHGDDASELSRMIFDVFEDGMARRAS